MNIYSCNPIWFAIPFICAPHIFYYIIYKNPKLLSFNSVALIAIILRSLSFLVTSFILYNIFKSDKILNNILPSTKFGWFIGIPLIICGQILNFSVYKVLGFKGVYYGKELGVLPNTKYHTGFPFSIVQQPQYLGCILTIIGAALVWGINKNYTINSDILLLTIIIVCSYIFSIKMEA